MSENPEILNNPEENINININEILEVRREKFKKLGDNNQNPFEITKFDLDTENKNILDNFEEFENKTVKIAGRIMSRRDMGKATFIDVLDNTAKIQVYIKINDIGEEKYSEFNNFWDIGDIIGLEGFVFKTRRGEISVHATNIVLLSKSFLPMPEKFHGLKDTDTRYRQRYLDLICSQDSKEVFIKRSKIIKTIRNFLDSRDFIEVETPILNIIPGGANAKPFVTHHNTLDLDLYLRIAPELYLKKLIVGGMNRVYEMGRLFRNEGMSTRHNPEFTSIEIYEAYRNYFDMMDLTEDLIRECAKSINITNNLKYQDKEIKIFEKFERITMIDAVKKYTNYDFSEFMGDNNKAQEICAELQIECTKNSTWGEILNKIFEEKVEENLIQPTFVYDYPIEISPLTKKKPGSEYLVERFEFFVTGRELANAYSELNDPIDQRKRFEHQMRLREQGDEEANIIDEDFITALEYAMPPTGGLGIGIDRLVMLLTDSASIRDVLIFPTMKPKN